MSTYEILNVTNLTKTFGVKLVLDGINLSLNRRERAALVGENGTGKTTLARIILGEEVPDSGTIRFAPGAATGYLPQEVTAEDRTTLQAYLERAVGQFDRIKAEMTALEQQMAQPENSAGLPALLARYGELHAAFEQHGGYDLESRLKAILAGLQIDYLEMTRPLHTLSGGEKTRVALAGLLLRAPDLLILDEPTNHLDFAGIAWLENYLSTYPHALLMITHDRAFIDRMVTHIIELSPVTHALTVYYGNYEAYLRQREAEYEKAMTEYIGQLEEIAALRRQMKMAAHNPKSTANMQFDDGYIKFFKQQQSQRSASKTIRDAKQRLTDIQENMPDNPAHRWTVRFDFAPTDLMSAEPVRFTHLTKRYGDRRLFENISGVMRRGDRIVLVAPNGTGKTTLLRILAGHIPPDDGWVSLSQSAKPGYLDQEGETLNPNQNVLACYREMAGGADRDLLAELHRSGLFTDASLPYKTVGELSLGQRRKLALARIIASRANVLLLDEPANHLDLLSLEALEAALKNFPGAILAVSHDRRFIERVATHIWELREGQLFARQV